MRPFGTWKKFPPIPEDPDLPVAGNGPGPLSWWLTYLLVSSHRNGIWGLTSNERPRASL